MALWRPTGTNNSPPGTQLAAGEPSSLDALADAATSGGPDKDGISPIDRPRSVATDQPKSWLMTSRCSA
ncbi:hypothetical protein GCM10022267_85000 [Lentzea roselyniae]|uniref:Uncharacterized protein n=1 Tax=Lentzea roselyniae TaxID=531940 RepID=A0ABP7CA91_9PSEU